MSDQVNTASIQTLVVVFVYIFGVFSALVACVAVALL